MVKYNQHTLNLDGEKSSENALEMIRGFKDEVVVNIAGDPKAAPILFTVENLKAAISKGGVALVLETLPVEVYSELILREIQLVKQSSEEIRALLRNQFIYDIREVVNRFLGKFQNMANILNCYALQHPQSMVAENMEKLSELLPQLGTACFKLRDNVRFMDNLQYDVIPALHTLTKTMQQNVHGLLSEN